MIGKERFFATEAQYDAFFCVILTSAKNPLKKSDCGACQLLSLRKGKKAGFKNGSRPTTEKSGGFNPVCFHAGQARCFELGKDKDAGFKNGSRPTKDKRGSLRKIKMVALTLQACMRGGHDVSANKKAKKPASRTEAGLRKIKMSRPTKR
jgi:hypothetical protein